MNEMGIQSHDVLGWIVVVIGAIATLATIVVAIAWTVRAGEEGPDHPKRLIMRNDR